jgi:hypothetical protein
MFINCARTSVKTKPSESDRTKGWFSFITWEQKSTLSLHICPHKDRMKDKRAGWHSCPILSSIKLITQYNSNFNSAQQHLIKGIPTFILVPLSKSCSSIACSSQVKCFSVDDDAATAEASVCFSAGFTDGLAGTGTFRLVSIVAMMMCVLL